VSAPLGPGIGQAGHSPATAPGSQSTKPFGQSVSKFTIIEPSQALPHDTVSLVTEALLIVLFVDEFCDCLIA